MITLNEVTTPLNDGTKYLGIDKDNNIAVIWFDGGWYENRDTRKAELRGDWIYGETDSMMHDGGETSFDEYTISLYFEPVRFFELPKII